MAKKNYNFLYSLIFAVILLSPFGGSPAVEPSDEYYELTLLTSFPNFFLKPFNIDITEIEFNPVQKAFGTNDTNATYPIVTRGVNFETIQKSLHNFTSKMGLPDYIERYDGVFIAHEFWEDANAVTFNSADLSFVFDKNACAYSLYNDGRIFNNSTEIVKSDTWIVKYAENGTDTWYDVPQNALPCSVVVNDFNLNVTDTSDDTFQIISTKLDVNGTIQQVMNKTVGVGMQHTVSYTNNNPSWNNTKIAFSHILQGTPEHMTILTNSTVIGNQTTLGMMKYSANSTVPDTMANNSTLVNATIPIDISFNDLILNTTSGAKITEGFTFHFVDNKKKQLHYDFDKGLDKLWNIRFSNMTSGNVTLTDVYIDYMNNPPILGIGNTTTIDPIEQVFGTGAEIIRPVALSASQTPDPNFGCANNGLGCEITSLDSFWGGSFTTTTFAMPFVTYDISAVPANADIQQVRFSQEISSLFFSTVQRRTAGFDMYSLNSEDISTLTGQSLLDCIYTTGAAWSEVNPSDVVLGADQTDPHSSGLHGDDNRIGLGNTTTNPCGTKHIDRIDSPVLPNHRSFTMENRLEFSTTDGIVLTVQDQTGDLAIDIQDRFLRLGLTEWTYFMCPIVWGSGSGTAIGNNGCAGNLIHSGVLSQGVLNGAVGGSFQPNPDFSYAVNPAATQDPPISSAGMGAAQTITFLEIDYQVLTQPTAPLNLVCNPQQVSVDLDWFIPASLGGAAFVDGYRIERNSGAGFSILVANTGTGLTFFQDNTVIEGLTFQYRVAALTGFGVGVFSNEVSCGLPALPDPPTNVQLTNIGLGQVAVDWTPPAFDGNSAITGYQIQRNNGTGFEILILNTTTPLTLEFFDITVDPLTQYAYRVIAITDVGESSPSTPTVITTIGLPQPPTSVLATALSTSEIAVTWTPPVDTGLTAITGYLIERNKAGFGFLLHVPNTFNTTTIFTDQVLTPSTEYAYRLKTITIAGTSVLFSNENNATTFAAPDPPANATATATSGSTIDVQWDTPLDDGGSPITGYKIERKIGAGFFVIIVADTASTNTFFNNTNLPIGTLHTYRMSALNVFGSGIPSNEAAATTDPTPQAPPNVVCSTTSSTEITLNWDTPVTFSPPTGYQIDRKPVGGAFTTIVADTGTTATTFSDSSLPVDSVFIYRILAHTAEGDTLFSVETQCSTLTAPDFPPEDVQADFSSLIPHNVVLTWDIPDTLGIPITQFRIERDDGAGYVQIESVSGSTVTFTDTTPDNDVDQRYRIITVGTEGESVPSVAVPLDTNQISHWHFENSIDDTGALKNAGSLTGTANFNVTGHVGQGLLFNGVTRITAQESNYDFNATDSFGISTYYRGNATVPILGDAVWGLNRDQVVEDFTTYTTQGEADTAFPTSQTSQLRANPTTDVYDITFSTQQGNDQSAFNLTSSNISDTTWVLRFKVDTTALTQPTNGDITTFVGLSDSDETVSSTAAQDFIGIRFHVIFPSTLNYEIVDTDGAGVYFQATDGIFGHPLQVEIVYIEIIRTSATSYTVELFSDAGYSVSIEQLVGTVSATTDGLDFLKIMDGDNSGNPTGIITQTVDDIEFRNGTTILSAISDQILVSKATDISTRGYKLFVNTNGTASFRLTNNATTGNEISITTNVNVTDNTLHFIGMGYNGSSLATGVLINVDGTLLTNNVLVDGLSGSTLNNELLALGSDASLGNTNLIGILDETRIFGSGTLGKAQLFEVSNDSIDTVAPINGTITISGATFANISGENPLIIMTSGFPLPTIGTINLQNFTATTVNSVTPAIIIDGVSGQFTIDPQFFNIMSSLSNYTAVSSLTNSLETFNLLSNFDVQQPVFTFLGDFFFQQARNPEFTLLSFNFTSSNVPFSLSCNLKSELFADGKTFNFTDVFFVQEQFVVPRTVDVVVACVDPSIPPVDPLAPSFGGSNALLSFVSFGDQTGIGQFLAFTANYGDFFGAGLPFLFIIILAALFTGRSAPTGIIIIGVAIGVMWFLEIITLDPIMWGVIVVLVILGALAGKKFL